MIQPLASRFEGFYYDGQSARRSAAVVELTAEGVRLEASGEEPRLWRPDQLRLAIAAGEPTRLYRLTGPPGECLLVPDPTFAEALLQHLPQLHRPRTLLDRLPLTGWAAATCAVFLLAAVFSVTGFGLLAGIAARLTPLAIEERLGEGAADVLAPAARRCSDPDRERQLATIADRLSDAASSPYRFRVIYVRDPRVNAFAAPGGYIVVYDGLLRRAETAEEFAGVLAHEMEHVLHQHGTRALARELPGRTLVSLFSPETASSPGARQAGAALLNRQHRRSEEEEADRASVGLLARAKVETNGLARFLRRLQGSLGSPAHPYAGSHPGTVERVAALEAEGRRHSGAAEGLLAAGDWENARMVCGAR